MNDAIKMQISAFVDGELPDNEAQLLLRRLCQDSELRELAASYLAVGRALRGQHGVAGSDRLRERIAAAIDDNSVQIELDEIEPAGRRYLRPVAGMAIAATVALAAILGLQQINTVDGAAGTAPAGVAADGAAAPSYTVPDVHRDLHDRESGNLDALLATFELREDAMDRADDEADDDETPAGDDSAEQTTP